MQSMKTFLRTLPDTVWRITVVLAIVAFFTQVGVAVARSGAVSVELSAGGVRLHADLPGIAARHRLVRPGAQLALVHRGRIVPAAGHVADFFLLNRSRSGWMGLQPIHCTRTNEAFFWLVNGGSWETAYFEAVVLQKRPYIRRE